MHDRRDNKQRGMKEKIVKRNVTLGSWITLAHPAIAEIMANAGFDWLTVDLEHSVITIREAEELIRVIELCGVTPLVRLSSNNSTQIKRVMDAGAHGIIVPMVNKEEDAVIAVESVKYPPQGTRGVGLARAQGYGTDFDNYREWLESESIVIVQIEHIRAVDNMEAIITVAGVDGFIVGPYDLSGSLKVPGDFAHPSVIEAMQEIKRVAKRLNAAAGYHVVPPDPALVTQKIEEGYSLIAYGVDFLFLGEKCRAGLEAIRESMT